MIEMAIVGLGSWGLCVMERTASRARRAGTPMRLHLVEPTQLGGGVYAAEQRYFTHYPPSPPQPPPGSLGRPGLRRGRHRLSNTMDSTTGRARPLVAVGGSTDDEAQLRAGYRLLHQEVTVTYADERN